MQFKILPQNGTKFKAELAPDLALGANQILGAALRNTVALARCGAMINCKNRFNGFVLKPLKRLKSNGHFSHRAKATVLIDVPKTVLCPSPFQRFNDSTFQRCVLAILSTLAILSASCAFGRDVTLEDNSLLVSFDSDSGALTRFENKNPHWVIERRPELGASFRLYAPLPTRRYNPVFGEKQHAAEVRKVSDNEISIRWENLVSENGGVLPMSFAADITLTNGALTFASTLKNDSDLTVETMEYPCFGDLNPPSHGSSLTACTMKKGEWTLDELYPHFHNEKGYWGVTWPTKMLESPYCMIQAPHYGLSVGPPSQANYRVQYVFEQHPGVISGATAVVPPEDEISGIPVHLEFRVCHFVFAGPHSTTNLAPVRLTCFEITPVN